MVTHVLRTLRSTRPTIWGRLKTSDTHTQNTNTSPRGNWNSELLDLSWDSETLYFWDTPIFWGRSYFICLPIYFPCLGQSQLLCFQVVMLLRLNDYCRWLSHSFGKKHQVESDQFPKVATNNKQTNSMKTPYQQQNSFAKNNHQGGCFTTLWLYQVILKDQAPPTEVIIGHQPKQYTTKEISLKYIYIYINHSCLAAMWSQLQHTSKLFLFPWERGWAGVCWWSWFLWSARTTSLSDNVSILFRDPKQQRTKTQNKPPQDQWTR